MIPGFWLPSFPLPLIRVGVNVGGITDRWDLVTFVLDTGATHTSIHPLDATRILGLSPASLDSANWPAERAGASQGIGGAANYLTCPAFYALYYEDNDKDPPEIITGSVEIAEMTSRNQSVPSLLGWDVLQHFEVRVTAAAVSLARID